MLTDQAEALRTLAQSGDHRSRLPSLGAEQAGAPSVATTPGRRAQMVAIASGKGGVGKSSVAVNLAIGLAKLGRRVMLVDADLGTANIDVLCRLTPARTLAHVVAGQCGLEEAMVKGPGGFWLLPGASGVAQIAALSDLGRGRMIKQLRQLQQEMDVLLIDTSAGINPNVLSFIMAADHLLLVTTPDPTAIVDAYALIKTVYRRRQDIDVRVLVNMVGDGTEGRSAFSRLDLVCRRFLNLIVHYAGHLVCDPHVGASVRHRRPFLIQSPNCPASVCIGVLAQRLASASDQSRRVGPIRSMANWWTG